MKNYVQNGDFITFTAAADVDSGELVQVGSLFGVAVTDVANGAEGTLALKGVFTLPKLVADPGDAVTAAGDPVYFSGGSVTGDDDTGNNPLCGYALEAAAKATATVNVKLLG